MADVVCNECADSVSIPRCDFRTLSAAPQCTAKKNALNQNKHKLRSGVNSQETLKQNVTKKGATCMTKKLKKISMQKFVWRLEGSISTIDFSLIS